MVRVDLHIHISKSDSLLVNPERIMLMRLVLELGSMQKAAQRMGISYNKAWKIIEAMNIASGQPVIQKIRGGKGGGGAALTEYGYLILKEYDAIELMVNAFRQKLNTEINL